jgi:hypothetical protein
VEPLWNLLKTVDIGERFHREAGLFTSFSQVFAQGKTGINIEESTT